MISTKTWGVGLLSVASACGAAAQPERIAGLEVVFESPQVLVQAGPMPAEMGKARAVPVQVLIDGIGVPLRMPGGTQAASAVAYMQVRCQGGVWAIERLTAFEAAGGKGAALVSGQAPAGQLSWNRLDRKSQPTPSLLMEWLDLAAARQCAGVAAAQAH